MQPLHILLSTGVCGVSGGLLGKVLVVQSDSSREKSPAVSFLLTPWVECCQSLTQWEGNSKTEQYHQEGLTKFDCEPCAGHFYGRVLTD